jgi:hypothetical protein
LYADPFRERAATSARVSAHLLGARFDFESNSRRLLQLVLAAYAGLPRHRLESGPMPRLTVKLLQRPRGRPRARRRFEPATLDMFSGGGWLGAASQAADFVVLSPPQRTALVVVSPQTLASAYHTRYELIEFAAFTLAARCQRLASLHAACVGLAGRAVLLMGASGAGKSTLTMMCLMQGFDFLSEDSVFVAPHSMRATGVPNFLHVRSDSLRWLPADTARQLRRSPVIQRRSGVRKFEVDLRTAAYHLAQTPQQICAVVLLSARPAAGSRLLRALSKDQLLSRVAGSQAYAMNQPEWPAFARGLGSVRGFEMRRGAHPNDSVAALRELLQHA